MDSEWPGDGDDGISTSVVALGDDLARRLGSLPADECTTTLVIVQKVFGSDDTLSQGIHLRVDAMRWLVLANADIDLDQYFYDTTDAPSARPAVRRARTPRAVRRLGSADEPARYLLPGVVSGT